MPGVPASPYVAAKAAVSAPRGRAASRKRDSASRSSLGGQGRRGAEGWGLEEEAGCEGHVWARECAVGGANCGRE